MVLELMLIGALQVTSYRSLVNQTDSTPFHTATGEHVHSKGVAVSRDLLCPRSYGKTRLHKKEVCPYKYGKLHYGDFIWVKGYGIRVINDVMHERHKKSIDLWVSSHNEERAIGVRSGIPVYYLADEEIKYVGRP